MKTLLFSIRSLRRDFRAGELGILAIAIVIAVGAITTVSFFGDRIRLGMERQAAEMIAADLRLHSHKAMPGDWSEKALRLGLKVSHTLHFSSVAATDEVSQLAEVKVVDSAYPLRGKLRISDRVAGPEQITDSIPEPGTIWAEPRLLQSMGLGSGDRVWLGERQFKIKQVIRYEPDRGGSLFQLAPRIMLNQTDLKATGLIQKGSRVHYHSLFAGTAESIEKFNQWLKPRLQNGVRVESVREARPRLRGALDRAEKFLNLAALISALLAGVAIATASRQYMVRHANNSAILRCLGATRKFVIKIQLLQLILLGILASLCGCLLGYLTQWLLADIMSGMLQIKLPQASWRPVLFGVLSGLVALAGFSLPPLLRLAQVSPLRVLRKDIGLIPPSALAVYGSALVTMIGLMLWHSGDVLLTSYILGGTLATLLVLATAAWITIKLLDGLRGRVGVAWRFGLANIARRRQTSIVQLVSIGAGIMVMLLLALVRGDLLDAWRQDVPAGTPNHFLINIQNDQLAPLRKFILENIGSEVSIYPMSRARLQSVNGKALNPSDYTDEQARRLASREFNLSWSEQMPAHNQLSKGHWWTSTESMEFSVESGIAETLGLSIGDRLSFSSGGQVATGTISNLRSLEWESFKVNFFVIGTPKLLQNLPQSYITAINIPTEKRTEVTRLVRQFSNITVLDVDAILQQVRRIIERVSLAVELVFGFTLAAGLLVLYAAVQASLDERRYETGLLRALGANRRRVVKGLLAEFALLGVIAGTLAGIASALVGWALATQVFELSSFVPSPWLLPLGTVSGTAVVTVMGLLGTRRAINQAPLATLRE